MSDTTRQWKRTVDAAGLAGVLALSGVAYFTGYRPLAARIEDSRHAELEVTRVREQLETTAARLTDVTQRLSTLRREDETAVDMLPLSALNRRLGQISDCAERSGLKVTSTRPGEPRPHPHFVAVPLSLGGDCTFTSFVGFLRDLQREAPDVSVESFELTAVRSAEGAASAAFHVQAVWHARKDPENRKGSEPENAPAGG